MSLCRASVWDCRTPQPAKTAEEDDFGSVAAERAGTFEEELYPATSLRGSPLNCEEQNSSSMQFRSVLQAQLDDLRYAVIKQFESQMAAARGSAMYTPPRPVLGHHSKTVVTNSHVSACVQPSEESFPDNWSGSVKPPEDNMSDGCAVASEAPSTERHTAGCRNKSAISNKSGVTIFHEPNPPVPLDLSQQTPMRSDPTASWRNRSSTRASLFQVDMRNEEIRKRVEGHKRTNSVVLQLVSHRWQYDIGLSFLIVLNAMSLGWQVQHKADHGEAHAIESYVSFAFCILFSADIVFRLFESKIEFFTGLYRLGNIFDFFVVVSMWLDQGLRLLPDLDDEKTTVSAVPILRMLRLLRLMRVLRVLKVFTFFTEFRLMCAAFMTASPWRLLLWVALLVGLFLYMTALALTGSALDHCITPATASQLCLRFGTLFDTFFVLYEVMYGGIDWGLLVDELKPLGFFPGVLLSCFVLFSSVLVINAVTGIFVKTIHDGAQRLQDFRVVQDETERDHLSRELLDLFCEIDYDGTRSLNSVKLGLALDDRDFVKKLASMKLLPSDMSELLTMLDVHETGEVEIADFISGCLRMRSEARAMDIWNMQNSINALESTMGNVINMLHEKLELDLNIAEDAEEDRSPKPVMPAHTRKVLSNRSVLNALKDKHHTEKPIQQVELRAMSLQELRNVCMWIRSQCKFEKWQDPRTGEEVQPPSVNLYHFNHYAICPSAVPDGIWLQMPQDRVFMKGEVVEQYHPGQKLPVAEGLVKMDTAGTWLEVQVLRGRFQSQESHTNPFPGSVEVDGENIGVPIQVEALRSLSYKELVSCKPLHPLWFVSHWWGESVFDFVTCCAEHAQCWALCDRTASYWVCGYAHRQYSLEEEMCTDLENCSFRKAMALAKGTLLILDNNGTPFERIWCDFEICKTLMRPDMLLDMVTIVEGDQLEPVLLSSSKLPNCSDHSKILREERFPVSLIVKGISAKLEEGNCTVPSDKENILAHITNTMMSEPTPGRDGSAEPDDEKAFRPLNNSLHAYLALAVWRRAVRLCAVSNLDSERPGTLSLPKVLRKDFTRKTLTLDLSHSHSLGDDGLGSVSEGLPPNLLHLDLNFTGCLAISDEGVRKLKFPFWLEDLKLSFAGCNFITDAGVVFLSKRIQGLEYLKQLRLDFARCPDINNTGIQALANHTPEGVTAFSAVFLGTRVNCNIKSVKELKRLRQRQSVVQPGLFRDSALASNKV